MAARNRQFRAPYGTNDDNPPGFPPPHKMNGNAPQNNNRYSSPRVVEDPRSRGPSRLDLLEERIAQQERNSQQLIERAFKTKEDVIESLNFTHGTWQEEKHARAMLQEHIRTITAVVNRLNSDIASVEESIRSRDNVTVGTNSAVKNLEVHHVATLTDLRGRIVRADTAITKLSSDIRGCFEAIKQIGQQQQDAQSRVMDRIHDLESKLVAVHGNVDRMNSEQKMKMQHLEGDTSQQMAQLDSRTRQVIDDLKGNVNMYQNHADVEREKFEGKLNALLDDHSKMRDQMMDKLEQKVDENRYMTQQQIQKLEEMVQMEGEKLSEMQQHLENKVITRLDASLRQQHDEIARVKQNTRDGFSTVHESIGNMKTVMDGKRKLLEDQLRKEISQIRKMVVLV